jgi:hypothetical protein
MLMVVFPPHRFALRTYVGNIDDRNLQLPQIIALHPVGTYD